MRALGILVVLAVAAAAAVWWSTRPEPIPVRVAEVSPGRVADTVVNTRAGTVEACRRSYLAPAVAGQIARLPVTEGQRVETGELLLEVWNEDVKARLALAEAEVLAASAKEEESCLRAQNARREADRLARLRTENAVSEEQLDRAQTESRAAAAACRGARAAVSVARSRVDGARAALAQTRLHAPFGGVVAEVNGELGEYITPSPPGIPTLPAVDLIDDSCLRVSAPLDEVDAPGVRTGLPACISLDAFTDRICNGTVRRIAPYVMAREKQARTVEVEVDFTAPEDSSGLLVGYSADVVIELAAHDSVLRIPTEAVLEGNRVLVVDPASSRLESRTFEPGISNWEYTEVVAGLREGERVVISVAREGVEEGALVAPEAGP